MRKLLLSGFALTALAVGPALAADLPRKAPPAVMPPPPPPITWTGCYIGANAGGAFGRAEVDFNFGEWSQNGSGFALGGQIGCDYQFAGGFVIGARNMFDWTNNDKSRTIEHGPLAGAVVNFDNQWFDTLTARLGFAVSPAWLLYVQGGGAWVHSETNITFAGVQVGETSKTRSGWTIGGGVEWRFAPQWSAFLEGNYMDLGGNDGTAIGNFVCQAGCPYSTDLTVTTVLVGVNYRFW